LAYTAANRKMGDVRSMDVEPCAPSTSSQ
jgi:hypothetical protein